jgi:hypothetical protein
LAVFHWVCTDVSSPDALLWCTEAQEFKKKFEEVQEVNGKLISAPATKGDEDGKAADELAKELETKAETKE